MHSPGINGEREFRGQPANRGSPGKMAVKTECVCVIQDLYCVEWDVKPYYTIPYHTIQTEKPDAED